MEESTRSRDSSICDRLQITTFSLLIARYGTRGMPELSDRWLLFVLFAFLFFYCFILFFYFLWVLEYCALGGLR